MNKVITINLGGNAYQLEEGGYDLLRVYLEAAAVRLQANPDRDEILSDIEMAIAEKFRSLLGSNKTVVIMNEVSNVLGEMGPVEADPGAGAPGSAGASGAKTPAAEPATGGGGNPRRLYRIYEGAKISGVCNGMAAYLNIDPTFVRLAFVLLTIFWGTGVLVYIVMAFVVPEARSPEEKAAASGSPATAQEFIRRAREGYYETMKNFPDRKARREWRRKFRREMRAQGSHWRYHWGGWGGYTRYGSPNASLALPVLSLLSGTVTVVWICALISLLATGAVLGLTLPGNVPVWVAALVLFIAYAMLTGSLKAARRFCFWFGPPPATATAMSSVVFLLDAAVWCVMVFVLLWLALHYFPELHEAVATIPSQAHHAVADIQGWWHEK